MTRILLVGKGPPDRGGIAAHLSGLLDSPLSARHALRFLNLTRPDDDPAGGRFTWANVHRTIEDAASVWRAAADVEIVSIHSALEPSVTLMRAGVLALAARLGGARVFVHAHGGGFRDWLRGPIRRTITRAAFAPVDRLVAVARGEELALNSVLGSTRVVLVENGVDLRRFATGSNERHGPPAVLYAGLLTPRKGVVDLLRASDIVTERGASHELLLVGGTPDEGRAAESEVRAAASSKHVRFLGSQAHETMPELYRAADIFVLPSWWEAFPLSVLEAMASGLPVVATNVGDVPRIIEDGITGLLVPPRDPGSLANAIEQLVADPGLARRMGQAGRRRVERHYGIERCADELETIFLSGAATGPSVLRAS